MNDLRLLSATPPQHLAGDAALHDYERAWEARHSRLMSGAALCRAGHAVGTAEWDAEQLEHEAVASLARETRIAEGYLAQPMTLAQEMEQTRQKRLGAERDAWEASNLRGGVFDVPWARGEMLRAVSDALAREQEEREDYEQRQERAKLGRWLKGVYPSFRHASLADYNAKQLVAVHDLLRRSRAGQGLTFVGPTGTGKTHLACALLRELTMTGQRFRFLLVSQRDLLAEIKRSINGEAARDFARFPGVLVIDDAFGIRDTEYVQEEISNVFETRYNNGRAPTWITTNIPLKELPEHYGRLASRLRECNGKDFEMKGKDRRLTQTTQETQ